MGQKVHPYGFRLGIVKDWTSTWYADTKNYANYLNADLQIRDFLRKKLAHASVSRIQIERPANNARIVVHTARPGIVIGKKGEDIESLRKQVSKLMGIPAHISVEEIRKNGVADITLAGRAFRIGRRFLDDLETACQPCAIAALKRDLLVMHAPTDDIVGIDNARQIFESAKHPKSFVSLDRADHLLTDPAASHQAAKLLAAWASRLS